MSQVGAVLPTCFPGVVTGHTQGMQKWVQRDIVNILGKKNHTLYHKILSATENINIKIIFKIVLCEKLK